MNSEVTILWSSPELITGSELVLPCCCAFQPQLVGKVCICIFYVYIYIYMHIYICLYIYTCMVVCKQKRCPVLSHLRSMFSSCDVVTIFCLLHLERISFKDPRSNGSLMLDKITDSSQNELDLVGGLEHFLFSVYWE
jgi:hypothetical protein